MRNTKKDDADYRNQLKEFFESIRDENEGKITKEKLQAVAKELGYSFTDDELRDMIEVADPAGEGAVTYKGLAKMVHNSRQDFPRLKTTIEEIRRELTSLSVTAPEQTSDDKSGDQDTSNAGDQSNNANEPGPSTSKLNAAKVQETNGENDYNCKHGLNGTNDDTDDDDDDIFESDNTVIIGKVMKASVNDNRKASVTSKGKGISTKGKRALVIPVSDVEDDQSTVKDDVSLCNIKESVQESDAEITNAKLADKGTPDTMQTHPKTVKGSENKINNVSANNGDENTKEGLNSPTNIHEDDPGAHIDTPSPLEVTPEEHRRVNHSRQSAATRFSLDAGVVTAVDKYHNRNHRNRVRRQLDNPTEEEDVNEEDELQTPQGSDNVADENDTARDSKIYIRDKTRRIRRKASLTHSQQSVEEPRKPAASKPVIRKRSLSKGRIPKAKGPSKPSDKHTVFYSGLGCALKISQLRTKQRLLYQMWQLVYNEAMMRVQQTFRYDYARDPAPVAVEKPKPKKKPRQRNSLD